MKATIDIPDDLYRRVKARSAMEGRPVRDVALELFRGWVRGPAGPVAPARGSDGVLPAWFGGARGGRTVSSHALEDVRRSIARGRSREADGGRRT